MKKIIFIFVIVLIFFSNLSLSRAEIEREWYNLLLTSASIDGPTGLFNIPTAKVVSQGSYSMGVHRYKFKYNIGLIPSLEAGFMFNAEEVEDFNKESLKKVVFNAKYNLLKEENYPFGLSVGVKNKEFYTVASKYFPEFYNFSFHPGLRLTKNHQTKGFIGIAKLNWRVLFISDFSDDSYSFGMRVLLHKKLNFDFFLVKLENIEKFGFDNIMFGLNFAE